MSSTKLQRCELLRSSMPIIASCQAQKQLETETWQHSSSFTTRVRLCPAGKSPEWSIRRSGEHMIDADNSNTMMPFAELRSRPHEKRGPRQHISTVPASLSSQYQQYSCCSVTSLSSTTSMCRMAEVLIQLNPKEIYSSLHHEPPMARQDEVSLRESASRQLMKGRNAPT